MRYRLPSSASDSTQKAGVATSYDAAKKATLSLPKRTNESFPATSGSIRVFISAASSSNFNFNKAFYDLEIVSGSTYPVVNRIVEGQIKLSKEVTK